MNHLTLLTIVMSASLLTSSVALADVACDGKDENDPCMTPRAVAGTCKQDCDLLGGSGGLVNCTLYCKATPLGTGGGGGNSATGGGQASGGTANDGGAATVGGNASAGAAAPSGDTSSDDGCSLHARAAHDASTSYAAWALVAAGAWWARRRRASGTPASERRSHRGRQR